MGDGPARQDIFSTRGKITLCLTNKMSSAGEKQEGNGPIGSRVKVMISNSKLGLKYEIRTLNYPEIHVQSAEA